ncbi:MAG: hypothetical protein HRU33_20990 [Rhodobacteraceae bacterium]|nr:hypothetical protein [Paracoccaceae bacterium]
MNAVVVIVSPDGSARLEAERVRIDAVKAAGHVPPECGSEIPEAPARGAFRVFQPHQLYPEGAEGYSSKPAGYRGWSAIQRADAFDVMAAKAARHRKPSPFSPGQVQMGRHYRDLIERYESVGIKCSSLESLGSGGGQGGGFIDAVLRDREEIDRLRRRIGTGSAMVVRRIRPSRRGSRVSITDRRLVDMVCLEGKTLSDVLRSHGWSIKGDLVKALSIALGEALCRMGESSRSSIR